MADTMNLKEMVGSMISALIPAFDKIKLQNVKLHRIEDAGIWIEHQGSTEQTLKNFGVQASPKTLVFFLPWHQITLILGSYDAPGLSEKQFGI